MNVRIEIPEELFNSEAGNVSRDVLETIAAEGFRSHQLSTAQVRRLLGYESRFEVYKFLAKRGIPWVDYSVEEARREMQVIEELLGR